MHGRDKKPHKSGEPRETTITGCWLCSNNDEVATLNNNYRTGPTYSTLNLRPWRRIYKCTKTHRQTNSLNSYTKTSVVF